MKKNKYTTPEMEITEFETEDVITASNTTPGGEDDEGGITEEEDCFTEDDDVVLFLVNLRLSTFT